MTARDAYKIAFLLRCAEENLSPEQIQERISRIAVKTACLKQGAVSEIFSRIVLPVLTFAAAAPIFVTTGAATGLGLVGGAGAAHLLDPGYDIQELRKKELISTYKTLTQAWKDRQKHQQRMG